MEAAGRHPRFRRRAAWLPCLSAALASLGCISASAHPDEVSESGGGYRWKVGGVDMGSTPDLATAIQSCLDAGAGREVHVTCGGALSKTIRPPAGVKIDFHNHTLSNKHGGHAFHREGGGSLSVSNLKLVNTGGGYGFRLSRAGDIEFSGIRIDGGFIGIRVDSHPSRPYEQGRWVKNLTIRDCAFENLSSHGLETYGVDTFTIDNIVSKNCGHCGVLVNRGKNGRIGKIESYRCSHGGGYAGLRFANDCEDITVERVTAIECGRGLFTVSRIRNVVVEHVHIRDCTSHAILLQNSDGVIVGGGTFNGVGLNHYSSVNCEINAVPVGLRKIVNAAGGKCLDVEKSRDEDGANVFQWEPSGSANQKWEIEALAGGLFAIRSGMEQGRGLDCPSEPRNGTSATIRGSRDTEPRKWRIQSVGRSRFRISPHVAPSMCLGSVGTDNGDDVVLWTYRGNEKQQWTIELP